MTDEFNNDSLLELYLYESSSLLDSLDNILLGAESKGSLTIGNINEIFRIMHTIKGSSSMMSYDGISEVAHETEDLFALIRKYGLDMKYFCDLFDVVLSVSDFLKAEVVKLQENQPLESDVTLLISAVSTLTEKMREHMPKERMPNFGRMLGAPPAPAPPTPPDRQAAIRIPLSVERQTMGQPSTIPGKHPVYTWFLHIRFNEDAKMENIRAYMLINKLREKGIVDQSVPAIPEKNPIATAYIADNGFFVSYTTSLLREQIVSLVKGTLSVETITFIQNLPDEPGGSYTGFGHSEQKLPAPETVFQAQHATSPPRDWEASPSRAEATQQQVPPATALPRDWEANPSRAEATQQQPQDEVQTPELHVPELQTPEVYVPEVQEAPDGPVCAPQDNSEASPPPCEEAGARDHGQNIISVETKKLDSLMDLVGEIVIHESMVTKSPELEGIELSGFRRASRHLDKLTEELQDTVISIRMLPVSTVFQRMRRIVRDMGKNLGKEVNLILIGETTEIDKTILDAISDPIMHLVRNAMDHALESPSERVNSGKNAIGHIVLSAQSSGDDVIISVSDDGRGLDKHAILNMARANGLLRKPESEYTEKEIFNNLLFEPGLTTREQVSVYSGRGVGLDIVKSKIEKIGGSVIIESRKGMGANFILKIPLTLAVISCVQATLGENVYSFPIGDIREAFTSVADHIITDPSGAEMILLRGTPYPVMRLHEQFGVPNAVTNIADGTLLLVESGGQSACLLVDALIGKLPVVAKPLPSYLSRFKTRRSGISGCTIMGDGNISLIVNIQEMTESRYHA